MGKRGNHEEYLLNKYDHVLKNVVITRNICYQINKYVW